MENKEIKIIVPKGYEIDKENSTFECIKFKKKAMSYKDICHSMTDSDDGFYYIEGCRITHDDRKHYNDFWMVGAPSYNQIAQIVALNKLMNVARYLNKESLNWDDKHQWKWYIYYDHARDALIPALNSVVRWAPVYFDSEEHARQAIAILGEGTIKRALGVF